MKTIWHKIIKENPTFVLVLGLCPALAITTKFENAYVMGFSVLIILLFSNTIISIIKKLVPEKIRIPVYIVIIGTFVTIIELLLKAYIPGLYQVLGIYLPLITVNCIVLGRAISVASKEKVGTSIVDAIGIGLGFTLALMLIALVREILGSNTITLMDNLSSITGYRAVYKILPSTNLFPINMFLNPTGAFLTMGFLLALFNAIKNRKGNKA